MQLRFDTQQEINASGNADKSGGTPPYFAEADTHLRKLFDDVLDTAGKHENLGNLQEFSFSTGGMSADSHILYELYRRLDTGGPCMVLRCQRGVSGETEEAVLDKVAVGDLEAYIQKLNLFEWNGFRGKAPDVLDGDSFGLHIRFADGRVIDASGNNAFPKDYGKREQALFQYLDKLLGHKTEQR